jgi:hypothetical protein
VTIQWNVRARDDAPKTMSKDQQLAKKDAYDTGSVTAGLVLPD